MKLVVQVKGGKNVDAFVKSFPNKLAKNIMPKALHAGMEQIQPAAKANIHSISGKLANGLVISTDVKPGVLSGSTVVSSSLITKGEHAFIAHWLEFGTQPHIIKARTKKALAVGNKLFRSVHHPGYGGKPFMRPALDSRATAAVIATADSIQQQLAAGALGEKGKLAAQSESVPMETGPQPETAPEPPSTTEE